MENPNPSETLFYMDAYNDGIFTMTPRYYEYLRLGLGHNKNRDTASIRIKGVYFIPAAYHKGGIFRQDYSQPITEEQFDETWRVKSSLHPEPM